MIQRLLIFATVWAVFLGCTEEEVIPRTNPRFSVAMVQEVNSSGAEFSANIYDYGSEEIIEYGFVYGGNNPRVDDINSEILVQSGKPEREFKMRATQGLTVGKTYIVMAFVRTSSGVVYSVGKKFTSQGSSGFELTKIEVPEIVYFGDELVFEGENFPRNMAKIQVFIEGVEAQVYGIQEKGFRAKIPDVFPFDPIRANENLFEIRLKVGVKDLVVEKVLNFRKPSFELTSSEEISYSDRIKIKGNYLKGSQVSVKYVSPSGSVQMLEVVNAGENLIEFLPTALFEEGQPKVTLTIRGIDYALSNTFKLKPTVIQASQISEFYGSYADIRIKGENFNPYGAEFNKLIITGSTSHFYQIEEVSSSEMRVIVDSYGGVHDRRIYLNTQMGPGKSINSYILELRYPQVPVMLLPYANFIGQPNSIGLSFEGKGYFVSHEGIFEFANSTNEPKKIHGSIPYFSQNKPIYATGGEGAIFVSDGKKLFSYSLSTSTLRSLPDLPNYSIQNMGFFVEDGYLYSEYGSVENFWFNENCRRRFRLNLQSLQWEELDSITTNHNYVSNKHFRVNGVLYSYRILRGNSEYRAEIVRFNSVTKTWDKFLENLEPVQISTNEIYVLGEKIYFPAFANSFVMDSKTWQFRRINNFYFGLNPETGFQIGKYFYQINYNASHAILYEIDPDYFQFR
ncbi:hypothetical protein D0X99_15220 [Algoriphagus lacus]|uniref:IPT/TIG domain-containing protein n=1 Tax=Algoriphagus lacus TaxID=2056311 RepID=A0A418PNK6_9BACT|nr:hypothetical protein [Algoriphagus lacus]RIW13595.1 hypothetical protein D0X99_15220 [Algoriphagus lacus]